MAGYGNPSTDLTAWRVNPDGLLDPSLGGDGIVEADFGEFDYGYAAALQANGKIVAAGHTTVGGNLLGASRSSASSRAARWTPPSAPTASRRVNVEGDDAAYGMALQPNGRIVVAGEAAANVAGARLEGDASGSGGGPVGGGPGDPRGSSSVPRCAGRRATIVGTSQRDVLRGTRRSDVIAALAGNDRIRAAAGDDLVCAGAGDDRLSGDSGSDRLLGQNGTDRLRGGRGKDRLGGGRGRDRCRGGPGRDRASCEPERA